MHPRTNAFALLMLVTTAAPAAAQEAPVTPTPTPTAAPTATAPARSDHRIAVWLGFSHWFGPTFGSPDGFTTPTIGIAVRPGLPFLEVRLRYTIAIGPVQLASGADEHVGFLSLEVALSHEISFDEQTLEIYAAPFGTFVHAAGATGGAGIAVGARWLIDLSDTVSLGPFFEGRTVFYVLPGDMGDLFDNPHTDAQLDLGAVLSVF
jgi:hypothetical protein